MGGVVSSMPGQGNRGSADTLRGVLDKAKVWERIRGVVMKDGRRLILNRLLDGFEGKLTTTKYAKLTKSS